MPRVDAIATAFCDVQLARPNLSPNGKSGCHGCIAVDPRRIGYGSHIKVFARGTNTLLYEGVACDYCGAAVRNPGYLVDVWFPTNAQCNQWGRKQVTIEF